jgi:hypothetical protein
LSIDHKNWSAAFGDIASGSSFEAIFKSVTKHIVANGGVIKFDLSHFAMEKVVADIGKTAATASSYTNWEFIQVISNPRLLKAARFYEGGKLVTTQEVLKRFAKVKK